MVFHRHKGMEVIDFWKALLQRVYEPQPYVYVVKHHKHLPDDTAPFYASI